MSHDKAAPATSTAEELAHVRPSDRSPTDAPPASSSRLTSAAACLCAGASCNRGAEERCVALDALVQAGGLPRQKGPAAHTAHRHGPSRVAPPKPWRRCRPTRRSRAQSWPRATLPSVRAAAGTRGACGGSRPAHRIGPPRGCRARGHWPQCPQGSALVEAWYVHARYVHGMRRLGAQLLKLREELGVERQGSTELQAKMQEMSGDADGYHQTISVLQAASHAPCRYHTGP